MMDFLQIRRGQVLMSFLTLRAALRDYIAEKRFDPTQHATRHRNFEPPSDTSGKQFTSFYHGFTAGTLAIPSALPAAKRASDMLYDTTKFANGTSPPLSSKLVTRLSIAMAPREKPGQSANGTKDDS
jgi:hypothetical protein